MENEYELSYTAEQIDERLGKAGNAVLYTEQKLTDEQQAQARANIGAVSKDDPACITGSGAPTASTVGRVGLFYMNTTNGDVWKCIAAENGVYTWSIFSVYNIDVDRYLTVNGAAADAGVLGGILNPVTAPSKNLNTMTYESHTRHGITYTVGGDNSVTLDGEATEETWIFSGVYQEKELIELPAGTYTLWCDTHDKTHAYIVLHSKPDGTKENLTNQYYPRNLLNAGKISKVTFTTNYTQWARIQIKVTPGFVFDGFTLRAQLEKGETVTDYVSPWSSEVRSARLDYIDDSIARMSSHTPNFEVPAYYFNGDYLPNKVKTIKTKMQECVGNGDAFVFITDAHWTQNAGNSPALINYLSDNLNITKVISGGDNGNAGGDEDFCRLIRKCISGRVYHATGNHENFYPATGSTCAFNMSMYNDDVHTDNNDRDYYYFDNNRAHIRYIVLSSYAPGASGSGAANGYEAAQLDWLQNVALDVPDGWDIIVISHYVYYMNLTTLALTAPNAGSQAMLDILDAYNADENSNGTVACVIQGHTHYDRITHTTGGIPVVITTCDKYDPWIQDGVNMEPWLETRVKGTVTEQAFDVVVIDKTGRSIYFYRIGASAMDGVDDDPGTVTELRVVTY